MTYAEYKSRGGTLNQPAFERALVGVCAEINRVTFGRAASLSPEPPELKQLIVSLCDLSGSYDTNQSEKYALARREMIRDFLSGVRDKDGVPLCFRGV